MGNKNQIFDNIRPQEVENNPLIFGTVDRVTIFKPLFGISRASRLIYIHRNNASKHFFP